MTVAGGASCTHWLIELAGECGVAGADAIDVSPAAPACNVWLLLGERCGVADADLARAIAEHFRVPEDAVEGILKRVAVGLTSDVEIVEASDASADTVEDAAAAPVVRTTSALPKYRSLRNYRPCPCRT